MKFCWEMVITNRCLASLFDNVEDVFLKFYQGKICFLDPLCSARRWYEFPFFSDWNETTLSDLHITRLRMAQSKKGVYFVMLMRQKFSKFGAQKVFYGDSAVHDWPHRPTKPEINSWSWQFNEILIPVMLRRACLQGNKILRTCPVSCPNLLQLCREWFLCKYFKYSFTYMMFRKQQPRLINHL